MPTKKEIERIHNTGVFPTERVSRRERLDANRDILALISELVELFPDQRFGQIICNYVFPEYRERDPFFEESKDTYNRLKVLKDGESEG